LQGRRPLLAPVLTLILLSTSPFVSRAAEISCDQLVEILAQTGENPVIAINFAKETVTIKTTRGFCTESIDAWSKRPALSTKAGEKPAVQSKPPPALEPKPEPEPKPKAKQVTVPIQEKKYTPPPAPKETAPPADTVPPPAPKQVTPVPVLERPPAAPSCRYKVGDVWGSMTVNIEGIDHWLVRAFTMDLDGDRVIDNVNFKFQAKNKSTRELQYFGVAGEISGNAYPALKLRDESVIRHLCFGQQKYKMPDFFGDKKERALFDVHKPDLAGEKDARDRGITYVRPSTKKQKPKEEETSWWVWLLGSLGLLLLLGGGGFWFYRRRAKAKDGDKARDEDGDGDEDGDDTANRMGDDDEDEDDEDKPEKKKGLGEFFSRFKGKKKAADANDEEDGDEDGDEDGKGKPEKKKKGLGGFFSRFKGKKKKKAAVKDEDDDGNEGGNKD